jgi:hypothetical protein
MVSRYRHHFGKWIKSYQIVAYQIGGSDSKVTITLSKYLIKNKMPEQGDILCFYSNIHK